MKILITGAGGQLGQELVRNTALRKLTGTENAVMIPKTRSELDITDTDALERFFDGNRPEAVINCAALTNVDRCETEPEEAEKINCGGVEKLCRFAEKQGFALIQLSTNFVFDGKKETPYTESDICSPVNVYGRTKLESENIIKSRLKNYCIVRTSWLYGRYGSSFVKSILAKAENGGTIKVVDDQWGCPACAEDVARFILLIIKMGLTGIFNAAEKGFCSKYEFARLIVSKSPFADRTQVVPCSSDEYPVPAKRPGNGALDISKIQQAAGYSPLDWQETYCRYFNV